MDKWIGKIAVVTGASSGIGAQILVDLAEIGVNVIGLARRKDRVEALANEHKTAKGKIIPMACDVSDPLSIDAVFAQIEKEFGKIHIWINNAGIWRSKKLTDETLCDADIIQTINTNFTGLVLCSRKAVNLMKKSNENGYIININSIAGQLSASMNMAEYGTNVYAGTKHAVTNVTEILRYETSAVNDNKIRFTVSISLIAATYKVHYIIFFWKPVYRASVQELLRQRYFP